MRWNDSGIISDGTSHTFLLKACTRRLLTREIRNVSWEERNIYLTLKVMSNIKLYISKNNNHSPAAYVF